MWGAFICGFGIPGIGLAVMLILTGVSYRFGSMCHINIKDSIQDYWAPIMSFAAAALVLKLATMVYCIYIYVRSVFGQETSTSTITARQAYRCIRQVLQLQWRGMALVLTIIGNVIFFAVVFIMMDNQLDMKKAMPWLLCLAATEGDRQKCFPKVKDIGLNKEPLLAVLILLSLVGFWNFILFARPSMFLGWADMVKTYLAKRNEFVSADNRGRLPDPRTYEMVANSGLPSFKTQKPVVRYPSPARGAGTISLDSGHYGRAARYVQHSMSFSGPRPPGSSQAQS